LGGNFESLVTLASSIELLHSATLVHDDLIDGSLLRRGMSTLNAHWSPAATILTGDFLFAAASDMAASTNSIEVMRLFSRTLMTIVNGEINQIFVSRTSLNIEEYYRRIYAKTASLFETSAQAAAIISSANIHQIELIRQFGYELGMAFQIVDDILDYTGEEFTLGKPVGGDLRQGIITLPMLFYIQMNPDDSTIKSFLGREGGLNEEEVQHLLLSVAKSNAIEKARKAAGAFVARAETCLLGLPETPERDALVEMARYIVERKK
jgi:geranylgeranyl pyrophosphate synthase